MRKTIQDSNNIANIFESFVNSCPQEAVLELHKMPLGQALDLLCVLPARSIILCFENMSPAKAAPFLRRLPLKQACYVLGHLQTLEAAQIFAALPVPFKARLKTVLPKELYNTLTTILSLGASLYSIFCIMEPAKLSLSKKAIFWVLIKPASLPFLSFTKT